MKTALRGLGSVIVAVTALVATAAPGFAETPAPPGTPMGRVDSVLRVPGGIRLSGWAIDPDTTSPIDVHVYASGVGVGKLTASLPRGDLGRAFPGFGDAHAFDGSVALGPGSYQLCVFAINVGPGGNTAIGCSPITVDSAPGGAFDSIARVPGGIRVTGWALDRDTSEPIAVHIHDNGVPVFAATADARRPDVAAAAPGYGENHGFDATFAALPGAHNICAFAINVGAGTNSLLGCRQISLSNRPQGSLEPLGLMPQGIRVTGWAIDPDTEAPVAIHLYVDGLPQTLATADLVRAGVVAPFPGYGDGHYFDIAWPLAAGRHSVCAFAIDAQDPGQNTLLGCAQVDVGRSPVGSLDSLVRGVGGVRVTGWAVDPDSAAPVDIRVYSGTNFVTSTVANLPRADVGAALPSYGPYHGFDLTIALPAGVTRVCLYAVDTGVQASTLLGCGQITGDSGLRGAIDSLAAVGGGGVHLRGWALDLDTVDSIGVHVYANGRFVGAVQAADPRADIGRLYTGFGDNHGFDTLLPLGPGNYEVCAYAINAGPGTGNLTLACRDISVV